MSSAWICCQIGAREHYAVPRVLHRSGRLARLYTDFWAGRVVRNLKTGRLRPLAARYHPGLENNGSPIVQSWNFRTLLWENILRQKIAARMPYHGFIDVGHRFSVCVREHLKQHRHLTADSIFFAYDTGALEAMEWCRDQKIKSVLNQMDPNRVEVSLVSAEEKLWPGWATAPLHVPEEYFRRREQEWALADRVMVNSEFCRQALLSQGLPPEKVVVVPLCFEAEESNRASSNTSTSTFNPQPSTKTLRVLFLGQVILRKGIQYLLAAAQKLKGENVQFDVVGKIGISAEAVASAPGSVHFHGPTTRDQAAAWYRQADVFVLPTISDGFAITQLEAMAHGLPVVTTACCGDVVSDGIDGFILPPRDAEALAKSLLRYMLEPELLRSQQNAALAKARQFTLERLAGNLLSLEGQLLGTSVAR